jgi:8-oxo-dGTP pyrophosphatase MutT (NUDIX family)
MGARDSVQLRRFAAREQAAAVCYRISRSGIEFLLVRTGGGRWTFPKGNVEPGLTHAQSAALEAFEEAGVHGCMRQDCFARYMCRKRGGAKNSAPMIVHAFLCEVTRLDPPQESRRNPTWFPAERAKRRLHDDRDAGEAGLLARVVDQAAICIRGLQKDAVSPLAPEQKDPLQKVAFEAKEAVGDPLRLLENPFFGDFKYRGGPQRSSVETVVSASQRQLLRLNPQPAGECETEDAWATESRSRALTRKTDPKQLPN